MRPSIADLGILAGNWQQTVGGMSFAEAMRMFEVFDGMEVPEPGVMGMLLWGGMVGMRRRRTRR